MSSGEKSRWARGHAAKVMKGGSSHGFAELFFPPHTRCQLITRILRTARSPHRVPSLQQLHRRLEGTLCVKWARNLPGGTAENFKRQSWLQNLQPICPRSQRTGQVHHSSQASITRYRLDHHDSSFLKAAPRFHQVWNAIHLNSQNTANPIPNPRFSQSSPFKTTTVAVIKPLSICPRATTPIAILRVTSEYDRRNGQDWKRRHCWRQQTKQCPLGQPLGHSACLGQPLILKDRSDEPQEQCRTDSTERGREPIFSHRT